MKVIAIIPARMNSSRFPGKPLAKINNKEMIKVVYENVSKSNLLNKVVVATCDKEIYNFNPFRLNSCGWDSKKNNAYVNQPRIFSAENKELDNRLHEFKQADEHMGRVLYSIVPYLNQEGIGIVLRLRGIQFQNYIPMYKAS